MEVEVEVRSTVGVWRLCDELAMGDDGGAASETLALSCWGARDR